jgi:DNA topoisomerase I
VTKKLIIVESPAKAKTISRYLDDEYSVVASMGHIWDLPDGEMGVDLKNGFRPKYIVSKEKQSIVKALKKEAGSADEVYLAADHDREGEAIAWHLSEALKLEDAKTHRIVFHEITKNAILNALKKPGKIDRKLVDAQQARRVLDRLVGFELSPLLWKKVKPSLSAGRVQSVAVRLIVDREEEIEKFKASAQFRVNGIFIPEADETEIKAELDHRFDRAEEAKAFLEACIPAEFSLLSSEKKPSKRSPAPPFTTSTLQQEASRKLGYSVAQTMRVAQQLYESGLITYMRTDSLNLSDQAIAQAKAIISSQFGSEYSNPRKYTTKSAGAQEAHEAIRPTDLSKNRISGESAQMKLYDLIYKRTLASQMADARLEQTLMTIEISSRPEKFLAKGEVILFDGFLKMYIETSDEEDDEQTDGLLPPIQPGTKLLRKSILAQERYSKAPPRYTEASLVRKLEELGIGRPSTYAPTISVIQKRDYVVKENRPGISRKIQQFSLIGDTVKSSTKTENSGAEKRKLFPTAIGSLVNRFLMAHFDDILDYKFTANVEKEFDEIATGKIVWNSMIEAFYEPFHQKVLKTEKESGKFTGERLLGTDPDSGKNVYVRNARYGPIVQIGENDDAEKPRYASLRKDQRIETITLDEAFVLFKLPRTVGVFEDDEITAAIGRFGPYVRHKNKFYSLGKDDDPHTVDEKRAIELILEKREKDKNRIIQTFSEEPDIQVLRGRYGPYISKGKKNYRIPKDENPEKMSLAKIKALIEEQDSKGKKTAGRKKR